MAKRLTAPIQKLTKTAQKATQEMRPLPLHIHSKNEIGTLAKSFNRLFEVLALKQTELTESEENLRITLNSIGDAVIATDTSGKVTEMNPSAENLTGWIQAEAMGKPLSEVFHIINAQTRLPVENPAEKVLKVGKIVGLANHTVLISKGGTEYQIADSGAPIQDETGKITGVVLVFRDATEQLRAEQESLKAKKLESVGILAGGIAHDFNNLLTGVFGNIEMAKMFLTADHKSHKFLESAERSMERATNLTSQLLTFARGGDPIKETLSISDVILEAAQFSMHGSKARLQNSIASDLWLVEADKGQVSQVINNLILNAQQAMPTGGTITITAENITISTGRYVKITVHDEGVGIAPEYLDKIFDPYFSTKQSGSGLGLASTHSIVRKHNGQITVDSQPGRGTTFTIYLPAAAENAEETTGKLSEDTPAATASSARILVMDDEEAVREVIGTMLEELGHTVDFASEGQEAVEKYRTAYESGMPYNIVIVDLTVPGGMGGQESAQEILKINAQAKIIISSGYATDPVMANYKEYGFMGIVVKPYHFNVLKNEILQVLKM
jgi:PAS domain S-box-containing protein